MAQIKEQSSSETCLPVCLISCSKSVGIKINEDEIKLLTEGLKFIKIDYAIGQLVFLCKNYSVKIKLYVDSPLYYGILLSYAYPKNLKLVSGKCDKFLLKSARKPAIVYVDKFYMDGIYHGPHFVVLTKFDDNEATIMDPWDGKTKTMTSKQLIKAISSLRNNIGISPKLIEVEALKNKFK